jgi:hypothetical protein
MLVNTIVSKLLTKLIENQDIEIWNFNEKLINC